MGGMDVNVTAVQFNGSQAEASVSVTPKGGPSGAGMAFVYVMEQKDGKWVWVSNKATGEAPHGSAPMPGAANPHGGAPPPGAAAPGDKMPSPEDLPPAGKKK